MEFKYFYKVVAFAVVNLVSQSGHSAAVSSLFLSQSESQLNRMIISTDKNREGIHKACKKELKFKTIPAHCYQWLKLKDKNHGKSTERALSALDEVCRKTSQNLNKTQDITELLELTALSSQCVQHLKKRRNILEYVSFRENPDMYFRQWMEEP